MALSNDEVVSTLNELIETCMDGEHGFRAAAEDLKDAQIRVLFQEYAEQRAGFARELQREVARLGEEPEQSGSAAGAAHRGWMELKSAVTGADDHAIISEAERGEDEAVEAYRSAMAQPLPAEIRRLVERQYSEVQTAHDRVRQLKRMTGDRTLGAGRQPLSGDM